MRAEILAGLADLSLGQFRVSQELPWSAAGTPLYLQNPRVFYVEEPAVTSEAVIQTLCGAGPQISNRTSSILVLVVNDAKQKPANYDSLMQAVEGLVSLSTITGVRRREVDRTVTFTADLMQTEFEFRFTETVII